MRQSKPTAEMLERQKQIAVDFFRVTRKIGVASQMVAEGTLTRAKFLSLAKGEIKEHEALTHDLVEGVDRESYRRLEEDDDHMFSADARRNLLAAAHDEAPEDVDLDID